ISVSDVEVTRDLAHAKVFVVALQPERAAEAMKGLKGLVKPLRYELGKAVKLRHVPELHFHYDDSFARGERIENLLRENTPADVDDAELASVHARSSARWMDCCCSTSPRT